ncbi:MAG TPA: ABC transporter substrate-binding protein [Pseudolabrys sp.]|nr:ABC transporter substrate-binding protein [Pseudolabrys sp.]
MPLRIGVHPSNLHLTLAQHWPDAFAALDPSFVFYPEGRETGRELLGGRIDIGGTGSTPPIVSQVAGLDVLYVAASAPRPANGGILVAKRSAIHTVKDLAGKKIALLDGSFHTYLLARVLEEEGLSLKDVTRVERAPVPSRDALIAGKVDAWVAMAPLLGQTLADGGARLLVPCGATIPNRSVFWTLEQRRLTSETVDVFIAELARLGAAIAAEPDRAARILADLKLGGVDSASWEKSIRERDWSIVPADAAIIAEQQEEADALFRHGDFATRPDIAAALRPHSVPAA